MGNADKNPLGNQFGNYKRDWTLYVGGGFGGGGAPTVTGVNRYTYWVDFSKFDVYVRKLITQNVNFEIFTDAGGTILAPVRISVDQSNDKPDENIIADGNTLLINQALTPPPYFINTTYLTQPSDFNYQNDQGRYVYNAYNGNGFGLGNSNKIVQAFVPQSQTLTAVWFRRLFRAGSTSDHTKYHNLIVEIWDTNKNIIATTTISKYALQGDPTDSNVEYYVTADDGLQYWIDFDQRRMRFAPFVKVVPGATHYICVKQDTSTVSHDYAVGSNTDGSGNYNGTGRYIFGQAYTAPYASTVLTAIATNESICFVTQRNNGRAAITFLWDSASYYWYDPAVFLDQFRFVKTDSDRRI